MVNTLESEPLEWTLNEQIGLVTAIVGLLVEMVADNHKAMWHRFNAERPDRFSNIPPVCCTGLWALSRHPNHFGNLCIQWGIWAMVTDVTPLISVVGPLVCTLIVFVSDGGMRLIETERELQYFSYDAYNEYKATTSLFWPMLPCVYAKLPNMVKRCIYFSALYD